MLIVVAPSPDRGLTDLGGELDVRAGRVHRRELDVIDVALGMRDRRPRLAEHVFTSGAELVLDVDVRRRDEGMDPRPWRVLDGVPNSVDVRHMRPREAGDHRSFDRPCDRLHRLEVTR